MEELELDKEYMQRLLHRNSEEISDLRLSEKKLELENMGLRNDVAALRQQFKNYKKEMSSLKQLVQTVMESKVEANEEKHPDQPLKLKSKNYTGKKIDDSKSPAYRYVHDNFFNISIFRDARRAPVNLKQTLYHLVTVVS